MGDTAEVQTQRTRTVDSQTAKTQMLTSTTDSQSPQAEKGEPFRTGLENTKDPLLRALHTI